MQTALRLPIRKVIANEINRWVDLQKARKFEPKIILKIEYRNFEIRTVQTWEELKQVLRLRSDVFLKEGLGRDHISYDVDKYDLEADHLIIVNKSENKIIGTYRLLCSQFTNDFYSQSEFDLRKFFFNTDGVFLELGRACVHKDYRNGTTLHLLWKGLSTYALKENADYLATVPGSKIVLEGHCDERGTDEYNLALGERRARSAFEYLRSLGVSRDRMSTVSYGESRPAEAAHNEGAWSKNRRVECLEAK